jgi:YVTN family beta-propeller protein
VPLSGGGTRFDYQSFDVSSQRLYVAHPDANVVTVFDATTGAVVRDLSDLPDVHGVLAVPGLNRLFATEQSDDELAIIDTTTFDVVARVATGDAPDSLAYAPDQHRVFVADERGGTVTVIDALTNQPLATIPVGPRVGIIQYDEPRHRILVASGSRDELVEIDPATDLVAASHDLPGCDGAHGLYLNTQVQAAYVGCEDNAQLLTLDLESMATTGTHTVGSRPDMVAFDPGLNRLYVASESGIVTAFQAVGKELRWLGQASPGWDAHSVAVDPTTHALFVPLASVRGRPVLRIIGPTGITTAAQG